MSLEREVQILRDHCNLLIHFATQVGVDNVPGFKGPHGINELLKSCDRVFRAADLEKQVTDPAKVVDEAREDAKLFGIGYTRKHPNGWIEHIPPTEITMYLPPKKEFKDYGYDF